MKRYIVAIVAMVALLALIGVSIASDIKTGSFSCTGSDYNVSLGFQPRFVKVWNITNATHKGSALEWTSDMTADTAVLVNGTATGSLLATNGVSAYAGSAGSAAVGFSVGDSNNHVNTAGDTCYWLAIPK